MTQQDLLFSFSYLSIGSTLIPVIAYFFSQQKGRLGYLTVILMLASFFSDVANRICVDAGVRGYQILNIFFVIQCALLCVMYSVLIHDKRLVFALLVSFLSVFIAVSIVFQSIADYQSSVRAVGALIMIFLAIKYCVQTFRMLPTKEIMNFFPMWVNMAILFYFAFNLFLFASASYIFKYASREVALALWGFHNLNNIIKNCMFTAGIYLGLIKQHDEWDE